MDVSIDDLTMLRPYTPDLMAWLSKFGEVTAYYDGNGHYARVQPAGANVFNYNTLTNVATADFGSTTNQFPVQPDPPPPDPPYVITPNSENSAVRAEGRRPRRTIRTRSTTTACPHDLTPADCDPPGGADAMRRILGIALALGAVAALVAASASGDGEGTAAITRSAPSSTTPASWFTARTCGSPAPPSAPSPT